MNSEAITHSNSVNQTLSNTFKLTSMALLFSCAVGFFSNMLGLTAIFSNIIVHLLLFVGAIGLIFYISKNSDSSKGLYGIFAFAGIYGLMLDPFVSMALSVNPGAVSSALLTTSIITFVMSQIGKNKEKDFSGLGNYLFFGLIAVIVAMLINIFLGSSLMSIVISSVAALIFSLYIMYDVNQIVRGGERNYITASLSMFLNIVGLFIHLLSIFMSVDD